jgi:beta-alanine--pyruvate transaminase
MTEPATASIDGLNLDPYWMPFTHNRYFKARRPLDRLLVSAEGAYYTSSEGKKLFDGLSGLWCSGLGHGDVRIKDAVKRQLDVADYVPSFQVASPDTFRLAERIAQHAPGDLNHVFFTNSGSEAVDTALKIALAYHRARGEARAPASSAASAAITASASAASRSAAWSPTARCSPARHAARRRSPAAHLQPRHSRPSPSGQPEWGAHLADELERIVACTTPRPSPPSSSSRWQGSTGVLIPPKGYLEKLREICDKHGILLIFDEVITGFGRLGNAFAAERFGVTPDMITCAKGITNGTVPMGGVIARKGIYDAFMTGAGAPDRAVPRLHLLRPPARLRRGPTASMQGSSVPPRRTWAIALVPREAPTPSSSLRRWRARRSPMRRVILHRPQPATPRRTISGTGPMHCHPLPATSPSMAARRALPCR